MADRKCRKCVRSPGDVEMLAVDNDDATQTTMLAADRPPRIISCFAGPSLLAGLAVNHFAYHLPYYRLEEILGRSQLTIDRSTQCRWMIRLSKALSPLTDLMRTLALKSSVVQADETPVKMLAPGQGKTSTTYLWAVLALAALEVAAASLHGVLVHRKSFTRRPCRILRRLRRHARVGCVHRLRTFKFQFARPDSDRGLLRAVTDAQRWSDGSSRNCIRSDLLEKPPPRWATSGGCAILKTNCANSPTMNVTHNTSCDRDRCSTNSKSGWMSNSKRCVRNMTCEARSTK